MRVDLLSGQTDFFRTAFFGPSGQDLNILSASATQLVVQQPETGAVTTITGVGFTFFGTIPTGGVITSASFEQSGTVVATMSDINWAITDMNAALIAADSDNLGPMQALWNAAPLILDGSVATGGVDLTETGTDLIGFDFEFTTQVTIVGSVHDDELIGGSGDDVISPGESNGFDVVRGSAGNDQIDFTNSLLHYQELNYSGLTNGINVNIDGAANTGTVNKGSLGIDTLINVQNPLLAGWVAGGFGFRGTAFNDIFTLNGGAETWMQVSGGAGNDVFNLTLDSTIRLDYNWDGADGPDHGVNINIAKGKTFDDGFGDVDTFNITAGNGRLQLRGTNFDDRMVGGSGSEDFIGRQGDDVMIGGGGRDRIRYDRNGVDAVTVNLKKNKATGDWDGEAFTDKILKMEDIRGSKEGNDKLTGNGGQNKIEGRGGNDLIKGLNGDDDLHGEAGRDKLFGGGGNDLLFGGDDNDLLKGSGGNDWMVGGAGNDKHYGGSGFDNFVFNINLNEGRDQVYKFQDGVDAIAVEGAGFADVASITATGPKGRHTTVTLDSGTEIVLRNTDSSLITEDDFNFF